MSIVFLAQGFLKVFEASQGFYLKQKSRNRNDFRTFVELLGRFELPTSSLPTLAGKDFLLFAYRSLLRFFLYFQRFRGFSVLGLPPPVVPYYRS